jgi:hypothetical protein
MSDIGGQSRPRDYERGLAILTRIGRRPPCSDALDAGSASIKVVGLVAMMRQPEPGVEHEAARVHNPFRRRGGIATHGAGAAA